MCGIMKVPNDHNREFHKQYPIGLIKCTDEQRARDKHWACLASEKLK